MSPGHTGMQRHTVVPSVKPFKSLTLKWRDLLSRQMSLVVIRAAMKRNLLRDRIDVIMTWIAEIIGFYCQVVYRYPGVVSEGGKRSPGQDGANPWFMCDLTKENKHFCGFNSTTS